MPKRVALVLSGGGAKGAFQVGAEKYAREVKGYRWSVISGVSIGALNGAYLAMENYDRLLEIWQTITTEKVFGRPRTWNIIGRIVRGKPSFFDAARFRPYFDEVDPGAMTVDLLVGAVSLVTGEYRLFRPGDPGFTRALLASAALPPLLPPVTVGAGVTDMIDGGARCAWPLGDVLETDPDEIVLLNCAAPASLPIETAPKAALLISQRAFEIAMHELYENDIRQFRRLNRLVEQAATAGVTLCDANGRPYRNIPLTVIEPDDRLGETVDFSQTNIRRSLDAGWEKAKKILG